MERNAIRFFVRVLGVLPCSALSRAASGLIILTTLGWTGAALAGGVTYEVRTPDGEASRLHLSWRDDDAAIIRVSTDGRPADGYMLVRDGRLYIVTESEGQSYVMDVADMADMAGLGGEVALPDARQATAVSLEPTGVQKRVDLFSGEVHRLVATLADGSESHGEVVLTDAALIVEAGRHFGRMNAALSGGEVDALGRTLLERDHGILGYRGDDGSEMRLFAVTGDRPPASAFELPAEPMSMPSFGAGADSGGQTGDGLFGGLFRRVGSEVERQAQRQDEHAEERIERETEDAADRAVGRALRKIFGG